MLLFSLLLLELLLEMNRVDDQQFFFSTISDADFVAPATLSTDHARQPVKSREKIAMLDGRIQDQRNGVTVLQLLEILAKGDFSFLPEMPLQFIARLPLP